MPKATALVSYEHTSWFLWIQTQKTLKDMERTTEHTLLFSDIEYQMLLSSPKEF